MANPSRPPAAGRLVAPVGRVAPGRDGGVANPKPNIVLAGGGWRAPCRSAANSSGVGRDYRALQTSMTVIRSDAC